MEQTLENHVFQIPTKQLLTEDHLATFQSSNCRQNILGFILSLQQSVQSTRRSQTSPTSNCRAILPILDSISAWVDECPPLEQPQRYGNKAFTSLHSRIEQEGRSLIRSVFAGSPFSEALIAKEADAELNWYLSSAFGDPVRIDYGTGHELNFVCFLLCLYMLGLLTEADRASTIHHVFWRYMETMRKIQNTYRLEPAGSHGVWGLDDYHFLPFLFGASELIDHLDFAPSSIHDERSIREGSNEYLYFHCIAYIREAKSGHFGEHSPMLNDISGVGTWSKVSQGMVKMYQNEVLNKHPVMKHFLFGSLIINNQFKEQKLTKPASHQYKAYNNNVKQSHLYQLNQHEERRERRTALDSGWELELR